MDWMLLPLKRYADFSGRSRRMEYWMFILGTVIVYAVLAVLFFALGGERPGSNAGVIPLILFVVIALGLLIPSIAVQVRRFHDQDKSGWLVLLSFIPYVGGIIVLVFMCLAGTKGPNRFGPDPLDPSGAEHLGEVFR